MTTAQFDALLDQMLGLSEGHAWSADEVSLARGRLAEALDRAREHAAPVEAQSLGSRISAARIVAYAGRALGRDETRAFEAELAASPAAFLDVRDALDFLDDVEGRLEAAPNDLD